MGSAFFSGVAALDADVMYQLFIMFMITDLKTMVRFTRGRASSSSSSALVEMLLRLNRVAHAPFYALFPVGPAALVLELWWKSRRTRPTVIPSV